MEESDPVTDRAATRVGALLKDKWRLDKLLGVGGMAAVYAATHRNSKRVAVKMLHPEMSLDRDIRTRFLREGYVANQVGHRGAVAVDDDDTTDDGSAFLVMELLDGETLDARMRRKGGRLSQQEVLSLMDQVLDTLAAAHDKGIVHRDLKPENLFLTRDGVVKVLDFGIARLRELSGNSNATLTGSLMGTPAFMAQEQAKGRWDEVDARTDLWAIGATMFMLLSGRFVHEAGTVNEALARAVMSPARSVLTVAPHADPVIVELIDKALAYDREERWQTALEMQTALRTAYTLLGGGQRMPQLSMPDDGPGSEEPSIPEQPSKPSTLTTGRAVTSPSPHVPSGTLGTAPLSSRKRVRLAALGGGALLALGGAVVLVRGGHPGPSAERSAVGVAAARSPADQQAEPVVTPTVTAPAAAIGAPTVAVDSLPVEREGGVRERAAVPKNVARETPATLHASPGPTPPTDQPTKKAAPTVAPAPASPPPSSPKAAAPKPVDPFSKRY